MVCVYLCTENWKQFIEKHFEWQTQHFAIHVSDYTFELGQQLSTQCYLPFILVVTAANIELALASMQAWCSRTAKVWIPHKESAFRFDSSGLRKGPEYSTVLHTHCCRVKNINNMVRGHSAVQNSKFCIIFFSFQHYFYPPTHPKFFEFWMAT